MLKNDNRQATHAEIENRKEIKSAIAFLSADVEKMSTKRACLENKIAVSTLLEKKMDSANELLNTLVHLITTGGAANLSESLQPSSKWLY